MSEAEGNEQSHAPVSPDPTAQQAKANQAAEQLSPHRPLLPASGLRATEKEKELARRSKGTESFPLQVQQLLAVTPFLPAELSLAQIGENAITAVSPVQQAPAVLSQLAGSDYSLTDSSAQPALAMAGPSLGPALPDEPAIILSTQSQQDIETAEGSVSPGFAVDQAADSAEVQAALTPEPFFGQAAETAILNGPPQVSPVAMGELKPQQASFLFGMEPGLMQGQEESIGLAAGEEQLERPSQPPLAGEPAPIANADRQQLATSVAIGNHPQAGKAVAVEVRSEVVFVPREAQIEEPDAMARSVEQLTAPGAARPPSAVASLLRAAVVQPNNLGLQQQQAKQSQGDNQSTPAAGSAPDFQELELTAPPKLQTDDGNLGEQTLFAPTATKLSEARQLAGSQSVAAAEAPPELPREVLDQVTTAARLEIQQGRREISIQLDPPHLGKVQVRVSSEAGLVSARLEVTSPAVRDLLAANLEHLQSALEQAKVGIGHCSVSLNAGGQGGAADPREPGAPASPQPAQSPRSVEQQAPTYLGALRPPIRRDGVRLDYFA